MPLVNYWGHMPLSPVVDVYIVVHFARENVIRRMTVEVLASKTWLRHVHDRCCANLMKQVAQLSQRDRAARWVINGQKWKTGTERRYLRTI